LDGPQGTVTGFVIGKDLFFTAAEVRQMRVAPELVFMNATQLGRHSNSRQSSESESPVRFAASLPEQFTTIGSRAVLAPAGDIDDLAAEAFAIAFYEAMFAASSVGQAVLAARRKTYADHGHNQTWGMYLCYGDAGYRLTDKPIGFVTR
jgi:hypothetical protein